MPLFIEIRKCCQFFGGGPSAAGGVVEADIRNFAISGDFMKQGKSKIVKEYNA